MQARKRLLVRNCGTTSAEVTTAFGEDGDGYIEEKANLTGGVWASDIEKLSPSNGVTVIAMTEKREIAISIRRNKLTTVMSIVQG